jgi:hypothetical protein
MDEAGTQPACLINTSRGPIVMESDLISAMRAGRIAEAGIHVYDEQPPTLDYPFHSLDNVTFTPLLGYMTRDLESLLLRHGGGGGRIREGYTDSSGRRRSAGPCKTPKVRDK